MKQQKLHVYWDQKVVGVLELDSTGLLQFQYDHQWLAAKEPVPISISLPLRKEPYEDKQARPFFANLLPEAEIRKAITETLGISENNDFNLLKELGGECAGALSLWPAELKPQAGSYEPLSLEQLYQAIQKQNDRPLLLGPHRKSQVRLSLAGAQSKIPVYLDKQNLSLPRGTFLSSHIIKPPMPHFKGSVENEAYCMAVAEKLDLGIAASFILPGTIPLYFTQRYDRSKTEPIMRLHQEDFCQALGILPQNKYEDEGGPNLAACFQILDQNSFQPLVDKIRLLKWVIFNQLIGNADAHVKNLSLLFEGNQISLAPFYDLMCTRIYPRLTDKAAMRIGGEKHLDSASHTSWLKFAEDIRIKPELVLETVHLLATEIPKAALETKLEFEKKGWIHDGIVNQVYEMIRRRCDKSLKRITKQ